MSRLKLAAADADPVVAATAGLLADGLWVPTGDGVDVAWLYQLVLGRAPDAPGWAHWVSVLQHGETLAGVAQDFLDSAEFRQAHAGAAAPEVLALALGHLGGAVDAAGWEARLDAGGGLGAMLSELAMESAAAATQPWVTAAGIVFA